MSSVVAFSITVADDKGGNAWLHNGHHFSPLNALVWGEDQGS